MNNELKTLKDLEFDKYQFVIEQTPSKDYLGIEELEKNAVSRMDLKVEAIKIFKNLQGPETIYPILLENFPDDIKGSIAKGMWNDSKFRYGSEYGMLAMLMYFFNITEEDLK